jgi:uncharacterized integral membrane protein (TIGR00698 family)
MKLHQTMPGLFFVGALAVFSTLFVKIHMLNHSGISPLVLAIIIGILVGNSFHLPVSFNPGIQFAAKRILRLAIILYGFRITFQQIASVGVEAIVIDTFVVCTTILLGYIIGHKLFKLDRDLSILISIGAAICGAAAVLATEDILNSEPYKTAVAVGTVVLFGTLAMFLYPALQHANYLNFTTYQYGVFVGASIHEVAQAVVAGSNMSNDAGEVAVVVKMIRVLLLVPVLLILSYYVKKRGTGSQKRRVTIPWFALGFVCMIGFNSLHLLSNQHVEWLNQVDIMLLTMAMGAIGLETKMSKIKKVGVTPLYLATSLFIWLMLSVKSLVTLAQ